MKKGIHPDFFKVNLTCACGNSFETFSTAKELKIEICSACHPFFTGQQRFVDTAGRVEKFQAKLEAQKKLEEAKAPKAKKPRATPKPVAKEPLEDKEAEKNS